MRGRSAAATWLFAAIAIGLLAVGARAPRPRESARLKAVRARLERLAAETAPVAEDNSVRPDQGCLLDRTTGKVYSRARQSDYGSLLSDSGAASLPPALAITPSAESSDPSARDYAYELLVRELKDEWAQQADAPLQPAVVIFVSTEAKPAFSWAHWQTLLLPDLSAVVDDVCRTTTELWDAACNRWQAWTQIEQEPTFTGTPEDDQPGILASPDSALLERRERSILVVAKQSESSESVDLAERVEASILVR